jgi:hypothetical protein
MDRGEHMIAPKEICICSAVIDSEGTIWKGHRHADCISAAAAAGKKLPFTGERNWQGFITSKGRFVNRYEGYKLQIEAGVSSASGGYRGERLYSEDLY